MMFKKFLVKYGVRENLIKTISFLIYIVFSSLLCLFVYMAIFYSVDFLTTEKFSIVEKIPQIISSVFLLIIVAVINFIDWRKKVKLFFA